MQTQSFRRVAGKSIWHWSRFCTMWPGNDYIEASENPPRPLFCRECDIRQPFEWSHLDEGATRRLAAINKKKNAPPRHR